MAIPALECMGLFLQPVLVMTEKGYLKDVDPRVIPTIFKSVTT